MALAWVWLRSTTTRPSDRHQVLRRPGRIANANATREAPYAKSYSCRDPNTYADSGRNGYADADTGAVHRELRWRDCAGVTGWMGGIKSDPGRRSDVGYIDSRSG